MDVQNVAIPAGLLQARGSVVAEEDVSAPQQTATPTETYDAVHAAVTRASALSVTLGGRGRNRATSYQTIANRLPIIGANQTFHPISEEVDPLEGGGGTTLLQRATTVNLGGLARSRALGRPDRSNANLQNRTPLDTRSRNPTHRNSTAGMTMDNSLLFQSLNNFNFSNQAGIKRPPPLFIARTTSLKTVDSEPRSPGPASLSSSTRPVPNREISGRSGLSRHSAISMQTILRRASVLVGDAVQGVADAVTDTVQTVGNAVRRTSLYETYNGYYKKAQIRQEKLKRSKVTMVAFRYTFYLFLLALLYFLMIGFPLWTGLVLEIYYLLSRSLVIPGGFAIFIGVAFL